ncbi:MAG: SprT family zinc-dependent metalloprotease [Bacteroidota bacterium]
MSTKKEGKKEEPIKVRDLDITVIRKPIKHMHLTVNPPHGGVQLSAPLHADREMLRLFAISKLSWIRKQIKAFQEQLRETPRSMVNGESHYFQGRRYLLEVITHSGPNRVEWQGKKLRLFTRPSSSLENKERILREWYRSHLKQQVPPLIDKWSPRLGVEVNHWGIKVMRTKWGSCNTDKARILLNLHLAKKPPICLEYILLHEMVHLLERHHTARFMAYMDHHMPDWRLRREELNRAPLAHEDWGY